MQLPQFASSCKISCMYNREAAIFNNKSSQLESAKKLAEALRATSAFDQVTIFTRDGGATSDTCAIKVIPESCDSISKARNFINMSFKASGFVGHLHVLEDIIELKSDPKAFLDALEKMMSVLDYDVWLDASCDPCNYVYAKFNPRLSVELDREEVKNLGLSSKILFTSHSNTAWMCYDFSKASDDLLKFNESFDIPMFMIIEFLARRRNTRRPDQLYRMNMYMTVLEELGVFGVTQPSAGEDFKPEKMTEEDKAFKALALNFAPDNNIDELLESLWAKLKSKCEAK